MKKVNVPSDYKCPLCPEHVDDIFYNSKIIGKPICLGCSEELSNLIEDEESRPDDFLLDKVEEITGLSFKEYKKLGLEESKEEFERRLMSDNIKNEAKEEMNATGRTLEEVKAGWKQLIKYYQEEINKLG